MRAAFAPVDALAAKRAPALPQSLDTRAIGAEPGAATRRQSEAVDGGRERTFLDEPGAKRDRQLARQMVIADAGARRRRIARAGTGALQTPGSGARRFRVAAPISTAISRRVRDR